MSSSPFGQVGRGAGRFDREIQMKPQLPSHLRSGLIAIGLAARYCPRLPRQVRPDSWRRHGARQTSDRRRRKSFRSRSPGARCAGRRRNWAGRQLVGHGTASGRNGSLAATKPGRQELGAIRNWSGKRHWRGKNYESRRILGRLMGRATRTGLARFILGLRRSRLLQQPVPVRGPRIGILRRGVLRRVGRPCRLVLRPLAELQGIGQYLPAL